MSCRIAQPRLMWAPASPVPRAMWYSRAWQRKRSLARIPVAPELWQQVLDSLPILDGLSGDELSRLRERAVLFLHDKRLTPLAGVELQAEDSLRLALQAQLPLLHLADLGWYRGFHEIVIYPDDFLSPQKHRDAAGVEHEWDAEHSGEAWLQGPVILAWPGVQQSGGWEAYKLVIHEQAHKLDMLNGAANGQPPPPRHTDRKSGVRGEGGERREDIGV